MFETLYLSYDGLTDPLGGSQILPYLNGLSDHYMVTIISFEKKENFQLKKVESVTQCLSSNISWIPLVYSKKPPVISTLFDLIKLYLVLRKLCFREDFKLIHCRSYLPSIVGSQLKTKGVKFLFDIRGFWADERVDGKIWNLSNPIYRLVYNYFKRKEKRFFEKADATIALTHSAKQYIEKKFVLNGKVHVIPCAVDVPFFNKALAIDKSEVKKSLGLSDRTILGYLGSIGTWYLLAEMLDFYTMYRTKVNRPCFVFFTTEDPSEIHELAFQKGIPEQEIFIKSLQRDEIPMHLAAIDHSVFFIKDAFSKMASSPTKHGELMAAGIPVAFNDIGDLKQIAEQGGGVLVNEFSSEAYAKAVEALLSQQFDYEKVLQEYYSLEKGVGRYASVYKELIGK